MSEKSEQTRIALLEQSMDNFAQKMEENHKEIREVLNEIKNDVHTTKEQALETNGRVNKLEWWKSTLIWGLGMLWGALVIIGPLMFRFIQDQIDASVREALSVYEITVEE